MSDRPPTYDDLAAADGPLRVGADGAPYVELALDSATPHDGHPGGSLIYTGAADRPLEQGTYDVRCGDVAGPLFLVPVGRRGEHLTYQVVFA